MSSSFPRIAILLLSFIAPGFAAAPLKVCADPQNPPFSTRQQSGFENRIAKAIGAELNEPVEFHWARMGRGFVREVMNKGACDALIAVPVGMKGVLVTAPYYKSSYVFVEHKGGPRLKSLDDPKLREMKVGVQVLEDDYAPPARALSRRGLTKNVVGFEMDEGAGKIVEAVADKKVDVAIVWGPLAGYYARNFRNKVRIHPVTPEIDPPMLPFTYEIGVGVRRSEPELFGRMNDAVKRAQPRINGILREYGVPTLPMREATEARGEQ
jgi:mxaJ protein